VIVLWLVLAYSVGGATCALVTLRRLPVIIARMPSAARERLLDQIEAVERGRTD